VRVKSFLRVDGIRKMWGVLGEVMCLLLIFSNLADFLPCSRVRFRSCICAEKILIVDSVGGLHEINMDFDGCLSSEETVFPRMVKSCSMVLTLVISGVQLIMWRRFSTAKPRKKKMGMAVENHRHSGCLTGGPRRIFSRRGGPIGRR
jgi:hypothetical protein